MYEHRPTGPVISPDTLRDVFFPFMKMVNDETVKANMIPFFHCCGNTWELLKDYIAAGYKGYQSVQQSAGVDWKKLKDEYGKQLTIWAGVQCETLINGSFADVDKEVEQALKDLMPGGGFIFGSTNTVQFGANTDNYLRALDTARKKGGYR